MVVGIVGEKVHHVQFVYLVLNVPSSLGPLFKPVVILCNGQTPLLAVHTVYLVNLINRFPNRV